MNREKRISRRVEARVLVAMADELRDEIRRDKVAVNMRLWNPLVGLMKRGLMGSANIVYKKLVEPHLDEIYDDEIEEDAEEWCAENEIHPCEKEDIPKEILVDIVGDVKGELKDELSQRYFVTAFKKSVATLNPVNIVKNAHRAIKKHGMKVGLKVAMIILIGDLVLPGMSAFVHPSLVAVFSVMPHTEIAIAALAASEGMDKDELIEWVRYYEEHTGDDLVRGNVFG
jgi:hypothetical protein